MMKITTAAFVIPARATRAREIKNNIVAEGKAPKMSKWKDASARPAAPYIVSIS
jgi:hypothetical protein